MRRELAAGRVRHARDPIGQVRRLKEAWEASRSRADRLIRRAMDADAEADAHLDRFAEGALTLLWFWLRAHRDLDVARAEGRRRGDLGEEQSDPFGEAEGWLAARPDGRWVAPGGMVWEAAA